MRFLTKILCVGLLIPGLSFAAAPAWKIDSSKSKLMFTATQNGSPAAGEFKTFTGDIHFDPNQLDTSSIVINVNIGSVEASYKDIISTLKTDEWFDVSKFPTATFKSTKIISKGGKNYEADGTLTIKDVSLPVVLNFVLDDYSATAAKATGSTDLHRTAFKVGTGEWAKTDAVKDEVRVDFVLVTTK